MDTNQLIRNKVIELAKALGRDARNLTETDILPRTGLLDSASILELIIWAETEFDLEFDQSDLSLENFGSIEKMSVYIQSHRV